jgi:prepilin-type N-terminal cleavage/methylation domain-containing protein
MRRPSYPRHSDAARARSGITLIEVVMVIAIIGIIVTWAFPKAAEIRESIELESGAQQVIRDLHLTQMRAIKENRTVSFFRVGSSQYQIGVGETRDLPSRLQFGSATPAEIQFASFGPPPTGPATLDIENAKGRKRYIVLNASGFASLQ